jgi:hypothetical protein
LLTVFRSGPSRSFRVKQILCVLTSGYRLCNSQAATDLVVFPSSSLNLLSNACKFCPKNEKAVVEVHSSAEAVDDKLRITISVKDTVRLLASMPRLARLLT